MTHSEPPPLEREIIHHRRRSSAHNPRILTSRYYPIEPRPMQPIQPMQLMQPIQPMQLIQPIQPIQPMQPNDIQQQLSLFKQNRLFDKFKQDCVKFRELYESNRLGNNVKCFIFHSLMMLRQTRYSDTEICQEMLKDIQDVQFIHTFYSIFIEIKELIKSF